MQRNRQDKEKKEHKTHPAHIVAGRSMGTVSWVRTGIPSTHPHLSKWPDQCMGRKDTPCMIGVVFVFHGNKNITRENTNNYTVHMVSLNCTSPLQKLLNLISKWFNTKKTTLFWVNL